ncbi:MAG: hypothetical protein WBB28_14485 [Crinalium sp.]
MTPYLSTPRLITLGEAGDRAQSVLNQIRHTGEAGGDAIGEHTVKHLKKRLIPERESEPKIPTPLPTNPQQYLWVSCITLGW